MSTKQTIKEFKEVYRGEHITKNLKSKGFNEDQIATIIELLTETCQGCYGSKPCYCMKY